MMPQVGTATLPIFSIALIFRVITTTHNVVFCTLIYYIIVVGLTCVTVEYLNFLGYNGGVI